MAAMTEIEAYYNKFNEEKDLIRDMEESSLIHQ